MFANKWIVSLCLVLTPSIGYCADFDWGAGVGHLYGTLIGTQFAVSNENNKGRVHLGFTSVGIGYERRLTDHISLGGTTALMIFPPSPSVSVDLNYYFKKASFKGAMFGLSLVRAKVYPNFLMATGSDSNGSSSEDEDCGSSCYATYAHFSLGYQF